MHIILLGAPGAGKGTQARFLSEHFTIPLIATGDVFRQAIRDKTPLGVKVKDIMDGGSLVPDAIVIGLVKERLQKPDCQSGYLLDGFPRTIPQAEALTNSGIAIDYVIEINVSDEEIVKRLTGRLIHPGSGRIYHTIYNPPKVAGKDDVTQEALITREDDKEETVRKRLQVYHKQTEPLLNYYQKLSLQDQKLQFISIDGTGSSAEIARKIISALTKSEN